ncbi:hypothetical protein [Mesorhizobium sp.]|uniref:hypothetical protein n=1 Tax=Mesorhizobium sp. TaxID=1871066 RepID=UPI0012111DF3|nr:hypothetical protein [Mesorhizobium sp.]TIL27433.1 MAG: hypothetical protein E5Y85_33340 [Mesorhizobium sp.]
MTQAAPILAVEKRTVYDGAGRADLGHVTANVASAINCNAGPIRLLRGIQGRNGGFGLAHIETYEGRVRQFETLGFRDTVSYVRFVACDYDLIIRQTDGRHVFQREKDGYFNQIICQWDLDVGFWSVTTAIPKRAVRNVDIVWRK